MQEEALHTKKQRGKKRISKGMSKQQSPAALVMNRQPTFFPFSGETDKEN